MTLTVGSLFTGIGGLDLGLERAGMTVTWQAENDPYCCRVLAKHWPHVPNLGDVTTINWAEVPRVDLICGGYPCQPFSLAGRRLGDTDPRHLWPHMHDAIRVLRPRWALLENVPGHLALGFGRVLGDLAEIGYDTEWDCIPAAAVGAPHLRWRIFVVAYPSSERRQQDPRSASGNEATDAGRATVDDHVAAGDGESGRTRHVADTRSKRRDRWATIEGARRDTPVGHEAGDHAGNGSRSPHVADPEELTQRTGLRPDEQGIFRGRRPGDCSGTGESWTVEPDVGRVAHGIPHRVDRLRALGNAVVPQVAQHIGQLIIETAT